jgi:hypothetical protein
MIHLVVPWASCRPPASLGTRGRRGPDSLLPKEACNESRTAPRFSRSGGRFLYIVLCYPFLDFRFLTQGGLEPHWLEDGQYKNVGSLGAVERGAWDGQEAELRLDAALLFADEFEHGGETGRPKRRRKPAAGHGFVVTNRRLLADMDGQVRVEVTMQVQDAAGRSLEDLLGAVLTTPTYVVRLKHTELISAGFPLARTYLEQSAKTTDSPSDGITTRLLREGAGSPFLVVLRSAPPTGTSEGTVLQDKPAAFAAVTCRLIDLAGRSTGVWQIWGSGEPKQWQSSVRMLCRVVCQLSEVTSLLALQQNQEALTPHLLDNDKTENFLRVRAGQLRRPKQGDWSVPGVQALAAQHLDVSISEASEFRNQLRKKVSRAVAGDLSNTMTRIASDVSQTPIIMEGPTMKQADRALLVDLLAGQALIDDHLFQRMIQQADLTKDFKLQRQGGWSGRAKQDALDLVDWALEKGRNPADPRYTTLASILMPELGNLGFDQRATVVALVSAYKLILDQHLLDDLRSKFQVPVYEPAAMAARNDMASSLGPEINWHGPQDALELQSWLQPAPPDFLDIGFLQNAIRNARAVCLVSVGATKQTGTGVLIGKRFLLTNYHVLAPQGSGIAADAHAASVRLRFGVFSGGDSVSEVALASKDPVPVSSPVDDLDFVLLRVAEDIEAKAPVQAAKLNRNPPSLKSSLSILQHPYGGDMQLAPSSDAVVFSDPARGIVQYVTRTASGSSGAPCFDPAWGLVAIHHAERSRAFGTIREGILIDPIMRKIEASLEREDVGWA